MPNILQLEPNFLLNPITIAVIGYIRSGYKPNDNFEPSDDYPSPQAMSLSSALVSDSPSTSCSPVTPPRYPTTQLKAGSSHTQVRLETFEDLLKQAGYSHTRVSTPRAERLAKDAATYSSHRRDDSADTDITAKDSTLSGIAKLLSWVAGSTQAERQPMQKREFVKPDTTRPESKPKPRIPDDSVSNTRVL